MIEWVILILLILIIVYLYFLQSNDTKKIVEKVNYRFVQNKPDWLVQAEKDYGMPMTYPQAADELGTFGYPKSEIDKNKIVIQSNLEQIDKDNLESLEEKKKDPTSNPPKYGITIASIYPPEEFLANNTGLKLYVPPPQSQFQPPSPTSYGTVITPDQSKILPTLNYSNLTGGLKLPVYNQNQCGCCWVVACAVVLDYHLFKRSNELKRITFPNQYTFCVQPNSPNGFSRQSSGCRGGIPTDVFVDINDSKTLSTVQNQPQNLSFNQNNNNCSSMTNDVGNPLLKVENEPFASKGVIALYDDGKFYFKEKIDNPSTFLPTSQLRSYTGNPNKIFTDQQVETIKYLLCVNGPMVIGINATKSNITNYKSGVVRLVGGTPDHAVALIGYENNSWIIQNSWSEKWGTNGIMYADINTSYITMMTTIVSESTEIGKSR